MFGRFTDYIKFENSIENVSKNRDVYCVLKETFSLLKEALREKSIKNILIEASAKAKEQQFKPAKSHRRYLTPEEEELLYHYMSPQGGNMSASAAFEKIFGPEGYGRAIRQWAEPLGFGADAADKIRRGELKLDPERFDDREFEDQLRSKMMSSSSNDIEKLKQKAEELKGKKGKKAKEALANIERQIQGLEQQQKSGSILPGGERWKKMVVTSTLRDIREKLNAGASEKDLSPVEQNLLKMWKDVSQDAGPIIGRTPEEEKRAQRQPLSDPARPDLDVSKPDPKASFGGVPWHDIVWAMNKDKGAAQRAQQIRNDYINWARGKERELQQQGWDRQQIADYFKQDKEGKWSEMQKQFVSALEKPLSDLKQRFVPSNESYLPLSENSEYSGKLMNTSDAYDAIVKKFGPDFLPQEEIDRIYMQNVKGDIFRGHGFLDNPDIGEKSRERRYERWGEYLKGTPDPTSGIIRNIHKTYGTTQGQTGLTRRFLSGKGSTKPKYYGDVETHPDWEDPQDQPYIAFQAKEKLSKPDPELIEKYNQDAEFFQDHLGRLIDDAIGKYYHDVKKGDAEWDDAFQHAAMRAMDATGISGWEDNEPLRRKWVSWFVKDYISRRSKEKTSELSGIGDDPAGRGAEGEGAFMNQQSKRNYSSGRTSRTKASREEREKAQKGLSTITDKDIDTAIEDAGMSARDAEDFKDIIEKIIQYAKSPAEVKKQMKASGETPEDLAQLIKDYLREYPELSGLLNMAMQSS